MSEQMEQALAQIAEALDVKSGEPKKKTNWDKLDVGIEYQGRAITLPEDPGKMPMEKAVEALNRKIADEKQEFQVFEVIEGYPHDAAVAFVKAMTKLYGWASPVPTPGFFGPRPPQMMTIKTGFKNEDVVQCPLGGFKLPGVSQTVNTTIDRFGDGMKFVIYCTIPKKERHLLIELANEARRFVREESIYRGKAIRLGVDTEGNLNMDQPPEFLDVTDMTADQLYFDDDIKDEIDTSIMVPIRKTAMCKKHKIPLKRGVLLEGSYGTGKTLVARYTARECELNGWTFILLDKVQGLETALEFAKRYAPAVVFAEDVDRIATVRDESANDLVNMIDGVISKNTEVMVVLTTNFVEKLDPVILRPGRLDAIITTRAPGPETVKKLIHHYAVGLVAKNEELTTAGEELAGQIPATIRECVERAKLGMIGRGATKLVDRDIFIAARTMKRHLELLNRKKADPTNAEVLTDALRKAILGDAQHNPAEIINGFGLAEHVKKMSERVEAIYDHYS